MSVRRSFYSQEPEVYGQINSLYEDSHQTTGWDTRMTPRKWRTIYAANVFNPTILYHRQNYEPPNLSSWIGKYYISDNSLDFVGKRPGTYINEHDIMRQAGMTSYRILYAVPYDLAHGYNPRPGETAKYVVKSKPAIEGRPGQLNLILDTDNKILSVQYF